MNYSQKSKQKMNLTQIEIPNMGDFLNFLFLQNGSI